MDVWRKKKHNAVVNAMSPLSYWFREHLNSLRKTYNVSFTEYREMYSNQIVSFTSLHIIVIA
jgi:hypothetical protein